ncbi:MAG: carboxypeptidase regulatory-like domain-containing protein [Candidatus Sericytochromatia bacterium]|nr:carboxypeptidase regulatory-like domain-containing protein [Candidatus Tanganyikabacteria bacterium]
MIDQPPRIFPRNALGIGLLACAAGLLSGARTGSDSCAAWDAGKASRLDWLPGPAEAPPGISLYGHAVTSTGRPVAGAEVELQALSPETTGARTKTDSAGRYAFKALPPAVYGLVVSRSGQGSVGPIPVRVFPGMGYDRPQPLQVLVGGLGERPRPLGKAVGAGPTVYGRTLRLPFTIRRLAPDGRLGMLALTGQGVMRLSPERQSAPLVPLAPPVFPRAATLVPGVALLGGPGAPPADLLLATSAGPHGELSRHAPGGARTWCLGLPVSPADLAVSPAGPTWIVGTGNLGDLAALISGAGKPRIAYQLPPGSAGRVALDKGGAAWLAAGTQGAIQFAPGGAVKRKIALPTPVQRVFPTPDGGAWATGGPIATRLDASGRATARLTWGTPIDRPAIDGDGALWFRDGAALVRADGAALTRHPIQGDAVKDAVDMVSEGRRQLWVLAADRRTVSILDLPCDCH